MFNKGESCFLQSRQQKHPRQDDFGLDDLFNKKFQFRFDSDWSLPDTKNWFKAAPWKCPQLESLKVRLNYHKSQLNDFNIEEWSSHTRRRNPAGEVGWKLRCLVNPEFLTQAWTKFYECAHTYSVVPMESHAERKLLSLHLCEAPGAFITSLNHYIKNNHKHMQWKWLANTLNPYYEGNSPSNMISDDRFMFHTLDNWEFGVDNTGNLMLWENSQTIVDRATSMGKVMLVTADGSIDCLQKPDAQEEVTSPLHYCEIVTALHALSPGGTFIFKLFTIFEHSTVCLMYLINHLFEEVNIYKPVTSRQGNSEVYAICLGYKESVNIKQIIPILRLAYGTEVYGNVALFPQESIPASFLEQIEECESYFCSLQCQVIDNNLQAYLMQNNIALHRDVKTIRAMVAAEFLWHYGLKPIKPEQEILKGVLHQENKINTNPRYHRGSYTERELYTKMGLKEKCKHLSQFLQTEILGNPMMTVTEDIKWVYCDDDVVLNIVFTTGEPVPKINSSKFIFVPIFKLYQQILSEEEFQDIILAKIFQTNQEAPPDVEQGRETTLTLPQYAYDEPYYVYEKRCFKKLAKRLHRLSRHEAITIRNLNTLTHFNVSILYILATKCFEQTAFKSTGEIRLYNLLHKQYFDYLDIIQSECEKLEGSPADLLNSLQVQITNTGLFFESVVFYNNTFYRNKCSEYLDTIEQSI